jgi:hypothetical protein
LRMCRPSGTHAANYIWFVTIVLPQLQTVRRKLTGTILLIGFVYGQDTTRFEDIFLCIVVILGVELGINKGSKVGCRSGIEDGSPLSAKLGLDDGPEDGC